jgi:hypothetical protein
MWAPVLNQSSRMWHIVTLKSISSFVKRYLVSLILIGRFFLYLASFRMDGSMWPLSPFGNAITLAPLQPPCGLHKTSLTISVLSHTPKMVKSRKSSPFRGFYTFLVLGLQDCGALQGSKNRSIDLSCCSFHSEWIDHYLFNRLLRTGW